MTEHVTHWLTAFTDGELSPRRAAQVEAHLAECQSCQTELENLQSLSLLLAEVPAASNLTPPETFVAQVGLQLPRKSSPNALQRTLRTSWRLAPIGLLGTWAFIQAVLIVSGLINIVLRVFPGGDQLIASLPNQNGAGLFSQFNIPEFTLFEVGAARFGIFPGIISPLGWGLLLNFGVSIIIGLLYLSWIASWWVQQNNFEKVAASNGT